MPPYSCRVISTDMGDDLFVLAVIRKRWNLRPDRVSGSSSNSQFRTGIERGDFLLIVGEISYGSWITGLQHCWHDLSTQPSGIRRRARLLPCRDTMCSPCPNLLSRLIVQALNRCLVGATLWSRISVLDQSRAEGPLAPECGNRKLTRSGIPDSIRDLFDLIPETDAERHPGLDPGPLLPYS